jgi:hypothetical protein
LHKGIRFSGPEDYARQIKANLPPALRGMVLRVDLATQDPRPLNPVRDSERRVTIFNPATGITSPEPLREIYRFIPARIVHFRVFSLNHDHDEVLTEAAERTLEALGGGTRTNI